MAKTREEACDEGVWGPLTVHESLGILLSVFPGGFKRATDCILAAHNCQEVEDCKDYYDLDHELYLDEVEQLPECGSERTDHCEGNVAKYCVSDHDRPETLHEASYDCTLAGATCVEWQSESGERFADCQAPQLPCEGHDTRYCDGTRGVICEEIAPGVLSPWIYDCADAWGSHCINNASTCEGPATGEADCDDGIDGDVDGKIDCMDDDCYCESQCDDGIDNEGDGDVDCDDIDCASQCP